MKRITTTLAMVLIVGVALSACGTAETASDPKSSHTPSDMTRESKGTSRKGG